MKLRWGIDQLYFYLVCFVMLITMIAGVTGMVRAGIELLIPVPEPSFVRPLAPFPEKPPEQLDAKEKSTLPADVIERELQKQQEFNQRHTKRNTVNFAMVQLLRSFAQLLVALPVYLFHWRKIPLLDSQS